MRVKTLIELLTLSTNLYMISRDEELMKKLSEMAKKGKEKINDLIDDFSDNEEEEGHEQLIGRLLHKAGQARQELEKKIEETVARAYEKMHITHTDQLNKLAEEVAGLKRELALAESRIINLEQRKH
ncbi:MAG: hypothetical protein AB1458_14815 [Bacteroidota bacterium]